MGYDGKPIGPDLTIVTVVLQYGVFASEFNGNQHIGWLHLNGLTGKPTEPCLIGIISQDLIVMPDEMGLSICQLILRIVVQLLLTSNPWND